MTPEGSATSPRRPEAIVWLHGMGETPQAWQDQVVGMPAGYPALAPWLLGTRPGRPVGFDLDAAAAAVVTDLDQLGAPQARLCGAGLGANVAMRVALDFPDRITRLVVSAAMVTPPKAAMAAQRALFKLYPRRKLADQGLDKDQLLAVMKAMSKVDLVGGVEKIAVPTLVVVGENDQGNSPGAKWLAGRIPGAQLVTVPGGGTRPHVEAPQAFNDAVMGFLATAE